MRNKFANKKQGVGLSLIILLFLANLFLTQQIMTVNVALSRAQNDLMISSNQNRQLKVKMAKYNSTQYLLQQAQRYGFIETQQTVYLEQTDILAKND